MCAALDNHFDPTGLFILDLTSKVTKPTCKDFTHAARLALWVSVNAAFCVLYKSAKCLQSCIYTSLSIYIRIYPYSPAMAQNSSG